MATEIQTGDSATQFVQSSDLVVLRCTHNAGIVFLDLGQLLISNQGAKGWSTYFVGQTRCKPVNYWFTSTQQACLTIAADGGFTATYAGGCCSDRNPHLVWISDRRLAGGSGSYGYDPVLMTAETYSADVFVGTMNAIPIVSDYQKTWGLAPSDWYVQ